MAGQHHETQAGSLRIARFLAQCGVASRRKAEELVRGARVAVNGEVIADLGRKVDPAGDTVTVDGRMIEAPRHHVSLAHNKPQKVVVSRSDPEGRATVYDLLPRRYRPLATRLRYAGRLDYMTTGLLVLSTDGTFINRLVHPRHHVAKTYEVRTAAPLGREALEQLRKGVALDDGVTLPASVQTIAALERGSPVYRVVLREGRNRQVRRMIEKVGGRVVQLHRPAIGRLSLGDLSLAGGEFRPLGPEHLEALQQDPEPGNG